MRSHLGGQPNYLDNDQGINSRTKDRFQAQVFEPVESAYGSERLRPSVSFYWTPLAWDGYVFQMAKRRTKSLNRRENKSNMIFEPCFVNFLKLSLPHSQYDTLRQLVRAVNVPKEFYDNELEPVAFSLSSKLEAATQAEVTAELEEHLMSVVSRPFPDLALGDAEDGSPNGYDIANDHAPNVLYDKFK
jgi:hypothetical protein